jgi:hypothetical protein
MGTARMAVIALVLGVVLISTGPATASGGLSFRHCGTMSGPGARFAILAHRAECRVARRVFRDLFAGRGHSKKDPATGGLDTVVDGWLCGGGAGGFSCAKLRNGKALPITHGNIDAEALMR